jgi:ribosomal protein S12 methylthiotransferase accessory factor
MVRELLPFGSPSSESEHWRLRRRVKYSDAGVGRCVRPAETIRRVLPLMPLVGVTRVAEVTRLDRTGIPNYMTVRPRDSEQGISYYNGKGVDKASARAGAMMEAIERFSGERCDLPVLSATLAQARRLGPVVDPREIIVPSSTEYHVDQVLEWVLGFDLLSRRPTFLPLNSVMCPYRPPQGPALFFASTNGLASGNCLEEALSHALCEVIERDTLALAFAAIELTPAVDAVLRSLSRTGAPLLPNRFDQIDLASLPPRATRLVRKLRRAGLDVYLRDVTATGAIPSFDCCVVERQSDGKHLAHGGSGTHPDARIAVVRALTEAAQSRVACIQGGREDLPEIVRPRIVFQPEELFGGGGTRPYSSVRSYPHRTIDEDVSFMLRRLARDGFRQVVAVDMTRPDVGVPVVRVVVPKAESWTVFHLHTERASFGPRVSRLLSGATAR